jgi:hypothetical protein
VPYTSRKKERTDDAEEKGKAMLHFFVSEEREENEAVHSAQ